MHSQQRSTLVQRTNVADLLYAAAMVVLLLSTAVCAHNAEATDISVSITPKRVEQGNVARIGLTCPVTVTAHSYRWQEINAPLFMDSPGAYFGFVPVAMDQKSGPACLTIKLKDADNKTSVLNAELEVIAVDFPVQHITVDESKVTLSPQNLERHMRERSLIENMFARSEQRRLWAQAFSQPLVGRISTPFGVQRFINKQPRNPHSGIDIVAPIGTPVKAAAAGTVCLTGDHFFAGNSVYIDHGHALFSMYFHLESIAVQDGQAVARGDIIGRVGATGRATGPHLHWGVRMYGIPVDPFSLLAFFEH